jgi:tetratricopeptide (TPR) repeat protein
MKKYDEAFFSIGQAMRIYAGIHGTNSQFTFDCYKQMAALKYQEEAFDQALQCYEKVLEISKAHVEVSFPDQCEIYMSMIRCAMIVKDFHRLEALTNIFFNLLVQKVNFTGHRGF